MRMYEVIDRLWKNDLDRQMFIIGFLSGWASALAVAIFLNVMRWSL